MCEEKLVGMCQGKYEKFGLRTLKYRPHENENSPTVTQAVTRKDVIHLDLRVTAA